MPVFLTALLVHCPMMDVRCGWVLWTVGVVGLEENRGLQEPMAPSYGRARLKMSQLRDPEPYSSGRQPAAVPPQQEALERPRRCTSGVLRAPVPHRPHCGSTRRNLRPPAVHAGTEAAWQSGVLLGLWPSRMQHARGLLAQRHQPAAVANVWSLWVPVGCDFRLHNALMCGTTCPMTRPCPASAGGATSSQALRGCRAPGSGACLALATRAALPTPGMHSVAYLTFV
jgi:hypothetical protein